MRKHYPIILSVLAMVLLSSACFSMATAQDETGDSPLIAPAPDASATSEGPQHSPADNSTSTQEDDQTYHILDDSEAGDLIAPGPAGEDANLISTQSSPDYSLAFTVIGVVSAVLVAGVLGFVLYRKQTAKTQN